MKCMIAEYMQKRCEQGGKPLIIVCALQMSTHSGLSGIYHFKLYPNET